MEICDILRKSVLKKTDSSHIKKSKKVTFCGTVKVFIDDRNPDKKSKPINLDYDCIEVKIVDKSSAEPALPQENSKSDDCSASDFLVHKVVYEEEIDHEDADTFSEEADETSIVFDTSTDEEALQFVVHKVTDHEDDLIQQELDLDENDVAHDLDSADELVGKLSALSIENILTHDKIIAFIDQKKLGLAHLLRKHVKLSDIENSPLLKSIAEDALNLPKDTSTFKDSELVLSPPLQELSLDKIVKAQSNNDLCELDISPLNSIQETDSESDISSEGTMIMMTTEECEKNEQHIRESFLKYESLKKEKTQTKDSEDTSETNTSVGTIEYGNEDVERTKNPIDSSKHENNLQSSNIDACLDLELGYKQQCAEEDVFNDILNRTECDIPKTIGSAVFPNSSSTNYQNDLDFVPKCCKRESCSLKNSNFWDKSLEAVEIPKDVRAWKIITNSPDKYSDSKITVPSTSFDSDYLTSNSSYQNLSLSGESRLSPKSDELENFVHASAERVQRIRRRYLEKSPKKLGHSGSIRGIRPRFCTTAEILRMLEQKNQPPLLIFANRSHVSWPYNETISSNSNTRVQTREELSHLFGCHNVPSDYSLHTSFSSEDCNSSMCDHDSVSSCPSIFFHERGVPEGASPPRSLSNDSIDSFNNEENSSNVVYFSMKV